MKRNLKYFFFSILIFISVFLFIFSFLIMRYIRWENEFEKDINQDMLVEEYYSDIDVLLTTFTLNTDDTAYLELSPKQLGSVLFKNISEYLNSDINIKKVYIEADNRQWNIYGKIYWKNIHAWVYMGVFKDNIQTAQIYFKNIYIGPYMIDNIFNIKEKINDGYSNTLVTVNENGFLGRYLENIELLKDRVVIKGSRY